MARVGILKNGDEHLLKSLEPPVKLQFQFPLRSQKLERLQIKTTARASDEDIMNPCRRLHGCQHGLKTACPRHSHLRTDRTLWAIQAEINKASFVLLAARHYRYHRRHSSIEIHSVIPHPGALMPMPQMIDICFR